MIIDSTEIIKLSINNTNVIYEFQFSIEIQTQIFLNRFLPYVVVVHLFFFISFYETNCFSFIYIQSQFILVQPFFCQCIFIAFNQFSFFSLSLNGFIIGIEISICVFIHFWYIIHKQNEK